MHRREGEKKKISWIFRDIKSFTSILHPSRECVRRIEEKRKKFWSERVDGIFFFFEAEIHSETMFSSTMFLFFE